MQRGGENKPSGNYFVRTDERKKDFNYNSFLCFYVLLYEGDSAANVAAKKS